MFRHKRIKQYQIAHKTVKVKWVDTLIDGKSVGINYLGDNRVEIVKYNIKSNEAATLIHEIVHSILDEMGEKQNERFVQGFSELLTQILLTAK